MSTARLRLPKARPVRTAIAMVGCHVLWWVAVPMLFKVVGAVEKARRSKKAG